MNEMYFKNILIADIGKHTARFQPFLKGYNVVTSQDNHVGKSSLLKSLYYAMGAEIVSIVLCKLVKVSCISASYDLHYPMT